jgi:predicted CopG family antitoxin
MTPQSSNSLRIDPDVYQALLCLKHGNMTFSDVIADLLEFFMNHKAKEEEP